MRKMSNLQKKRERFFAIAYTVAMVVLIIGGIKSGSAEALIPAMIFGMIALFSWLKILVN